MLSTHDRFPYHPWAGRPQWSWPNGAKLALYLGVNLEHFSFGEGLGAELAPGGPQPDVLNYACPPPCCSTAPCWTTRPR